MVGACLISSIEFLNKFESFSLTSLEHRGAALRSKTGKIGVLATQRTLDSSKYIEAQKQFPQTCFINQAGHKIVPLIEAGKLHSEELFQLLYRKQQS